MLSLMSVFLVEFGGSPSGKKRDPCDFLSVMFGITSSSAQPYVTSVLIFGHPELQVWGPCRILMILRRVDGIFKLFF